jgi:hypothetical protein
MEEVLQEIWNIDPTQHQQQQSSARAAGGGLYGGEGSHVMIGEGSYMDHDQQANSHTLSIAELTNNQELVNNNSAAGFGQGFENYSMSLEPMRMSLHLEGLQRGREIVDNAAGQYKQMLKEIKTSSVEPSAALNPSPSKFGTASAPSVKTNASKSKLHALQESKNFCFQYFSIYFLILFFFSCESDENGTTSHIG